MVPHRKIKIKTYVTKVREVRVNGCCVAKTTDAHYKELELKLCLGQRTNISNLGKT